jgi:hypothetical protein
MQEPSPCLRLRPISLWLFPRDGIFKGKSLMLELVLQSISVTNQTPQHASVVLCDGVPEVSPNRASFEYFPIETSLAAFMNVQGQYQDPV